MTKPAHVAGHHEPAAAMSILEESGITSWDSVGLAIGREI
jgi:hypothetical protein